MNYTTKQLQERYKSLPEDLKDAIWSAESAATIQSIGKKYGLNVEQTGKLASETGLVLLGLVHPKDYIKNLSGSASVDMDTARKIAEEVNTGIFSKVKENLKKMHGIGVSIVSSTTSEKTDIGLPNSEFPYPNSPPPSPKTTLDLLQKHEPEKHNQAAEQKQKPPTPPVLPKPELTPITPINLEKSAPKQSSVDFGLRKSEIQTPLIFAEKIKEEPHREQSQVIEIEKPNIPNTPKSYEKGNDPYKEPF